MSVDADFAITIKIVQSNELLGQSMLIRRDGASKDRETSIAIALGKVAEHLVVGTVLFDDVNNVLYRRSSANLTRNNRGRTGFFGLSQKRIIIRRVGDDLFGISGNFGLQTVQREKLDTSFLEGLDGDTSFRTRGQRTIGTVNIRMSRFTLTVGHI